MIDKLKLIELVLTMAYEAKINYQDVFSEVRLWDTLIYNHLLKVEVLTKVEKNKTNGWKLEMKIRNFLSQKWK